MIKTLTFNSSLLPLRLSDQPHPALKPYARLLHKFLHVGKHGGGGRFLKTIIKKTHSGPQIEKKNNNAQPQPQN